MRDWQWTGAAATWAVLTSAVDLLRDEQVVCDLGGLSFELLSPEVASGNGSAELPTESTSGGTHLLNNGNGHKLLRIENINNNILNAWNDEMMGYTCRRH